MNPRLIPLAAALLCACAGQLVAQPLPEDSTENAPAAQAEKAPPADPGPAVPGTRAGATADDVAALRKQVTDLQSELRDALAAQKAAPPAAGADHKELAETIAAIDRRIVALEQQVETLVQNHADLAATVDVAGSRVLSNLNTDPAMRTTLVQAANPEAAVRFYNYGAQPKRMQVNGTWHRLRRGVNTIRVPYGPVTVTECDQKDPITFDDWTPVDGGYVMVFDIDATASR